MSARALVVLVVLVLVPGLALGTVGLRSPAAAASTPRFDGPTLKHPATPPDFVLKDQHARAIHLAGERGKVVLLTFLYTHCPDFCPFTARNLNTVLGLLGPARRRVVVLAVSVDPVGDTPAAVEGFVREHGLLPQFHYLTGSRSTLRRIWRAYQVAAVRKGGGEVDHTLYTMVVDRAGKARILFDSQALPKPILHDVRLLLA